MRSPRWTAPISKLRVLYSDCSRSAEWNSGASGCSLHLTVQTSTSKTDYCCRLLDAYGRVNVSGTALNASISCPDNAESDALLLAFPSEENSAHIVSPFVLIHLSTKLIPRPSPRLPLPHEERAMPSPRLPHPPLLSFGLELK